MNRTRKLETLEIENHNLRATAKIAVQAGESLKAEVTEERDKLASCKGCEWEGERRNEHPMCQCCKRYREDKYLKKEAE